MKEYSIRKSGDNYVLLFRGLPVEAGLFATRKTALKHKQIAENERRQRLREDQNGQSTGRVPL